MKKAFTKVDVAIREGFSVDDIIATHKYIAFTPTNEDELYALDDLDESKVLLSSYPLDYDVSDGMIVPDERFMINGYSYRWAYVPIDFDLTQIDCPYIYYYDIFSPERSFETKSGLSFPVNLYEEMEKESYAICSFELDSIP